MFFKSIKLCLFIFSFLSVKLWDVTWISNEQMPAILLTLKTGGMVSSLVCHVTLQKVLFFFWWPTFYFWQPLVKKESVRVSVRWALMIIFSFVWSPDGRGAKGLKEKFFSPSLSFPHFLFDVTAIHLLRLIQKSRNMFKISSTFWIWREMGLHLTLVCSVLTKIWIYLLPSRVKWKGGTVVVSDRKISRLLKTKLYTPRCWAL